MITNQWKGYIFSLHAVLIYEYIVFNIASIILHDKYIVHYKREKVKVEFWIILLPNEFPRGFTHIIRW